LIPTLFYFDNRKGKINWLYTDFPRNINIKIFKWEWEVLLPWTYGKSAQFWSLWTVLNPRTIVAGWSRIFHLQLKDARRQNWTLVVWNRHIIRSILAANFAVSVGYSYHTHSLTTLKLLLTSCVCAVIQETCQLAERSSVVVCCQHLWVLDTREQRFVETTEIILYKENEKQSRRRKEKYKDLFVYVGISVIVTQSLWICNHHKNSFITKVIETSTWNRKSSVQ
jgi:hypothetical protein